MPTLDIDMRILISYPCNTRIRQMLVYDTRASCSKGTFVNMKNIRVFV